MIRAPHYSDEFKHFAGAARIILDNTDSLYQTIQKLMYLVIKRGSFHLCLPKKTGSQEKKTYGQSNLLKN